MTFSESCLPILIPRACWERAAAICEDIEKRNKKKDEPLTAKEGIVLLAKLNGVFEDRVERTSTDECIVCYEKISPETVTILRNCYHYYCENCISTVSATTQTCPMCRADFNNIDVVSMADVIEAASKQTSTEEVMDIQTLNDVSNEVLSTSPKIDALLEEIKRMKLDEKGVIFSIALLSKRDIMSPAFTGR